MTIQRPTAARAPHRALARPLLALSCAGVLLGWTSAVSAASDPDGESLVKRGRKFIERLAADEFERAIEPFDETMQQALPAAKLAAIWRGLVERHGAFQAVGGTRTETAGEYQIIYVTTEFADGALAAKVVFNSRQEIAGLFFIPAGKYKPPAYADPAKFEEIELTVGAAPWQLPATLTLPRGDGPFPGVVLVHGSGPHDRDESIGPNKPFRDLAQGLASRGVAALRYEKRTHHHRLAMVLLSGSLTVNDETVDDAVAAVRTLAAHPRIEAKLVFVLGHSLGGYLIPRIAEADDGIAGFVSLAGSTRPIEDLMLDQTRYILSLDGDLSDDDQLKLDEMAATAAKLKSPDWTKETAGNERPFGAAASYWLDLRDYHPAARARKIERPLLFLQGERDYQVTQADLDGWRQALDERPNVAFRTYPKLNHLLIAGDGRSTPAEYTEPGNVAEEVVRDIADWIKEQRRE